MAQITEAQARGAAIALSLNDVDPKLERIDTKVPIVQEGKKSWRVKVTTYYSKGSRIIVKHKWYTIPKNPK